MPSSQRILISDVFGAEDSGLLGLPGSGGGADYLGLLDLQSLAQLGQERITGTIWEGLIPPI